MGTKSIWYGYLEAGPKSSPVLLDRRLDTDNPTTFYLYNLERDKILEYKRDIVDPKLRELNGSEKGLADKLRTGYKKARKDFQPRSPRTMHLPDSQPSVVKPPPRQEALPEEEMMLEDDFD